MWSARSGVVSGSDFWLLEYLAVPWRPLDTVARLDLAQLRALIEIR